MQPNILPISDSDHIPVLSAEVRRLRDLLRGGPAPEQLAAFHRLEADAEDYVATTGEAGAALQGFLAAARRELEETGTLPDLTPGSALLADAETVLVVVVRFLSVLELFRDRAIDVRQDEPLADVWITWTAPADWSADRLSDEHDVPAPADPAAEGPAAEGTPHD